MLGPSQVESYLYTCAHPYWFCWELTTLWAVRLNYGAELKVTDPKEQQRDVEEKEAEGKERWDGVDC